MSRNKKILVGVAIVLALGAVAFANFKFKRIDGVEVTTEAVKKRHLEAIVSASGKIQAKRDVNISADTMGRVTELAVDEGYRVKKGQFLMQIDPRNLKSAVQRTEASLAAARSNAEQVRLALDSARVALKQAAGQLQAAAGPVEGRAHHPRDARTGRERLEAAPGGPGLTGTERPHDAAADGVRKRHRRKRPLRPEQGPHRVADRRHRHPPEHRGGRNGRDRHDEQCRHGAADDCRHVGHPGGSRSRRNRHPDRSASGSRRRSRSTRCRARPSRARSPRLGTVRSRRPPAARRRRRRRTSRWSSRSTTRSPEVRPGFTCTAEITTAVRDGAVTVPIQATTVREMILDEKGNIVRPPDDAKGKRRATPAAGSGLGRARAGADAQGARRRVRGAGQQGGVHADQDRASPGKSISRCCRG